MILNDNISCVSDFEELNKIRVFIRSKALGYGFSDHDSQEIALAVDEACTNLIRHAYDFDIERNIFIEIEKGSDHFTVNVLDDGDPFNPLDVKSPDMAKYLKKYNRGGLGIHLMRKVMDQINYFPMDNDNPKNLLKLTKYLQ